MDEVIYGVSIQIILYCCKKGLGRSVCTDIEKCPLCKLSYVIAHCVEYDFIYLKIM